MRSALPSYEMFMWEKLGCEYEVDESGPEKRVTKKARMGTHSLKNCATVACQNVQMPQKAPSSATLLVAIKSYEAKGPLASCPLFDFVANR